MVLLMILSFSEKFYPEAEVQLMGPGVPGLAVDLTVLLWDVLGIQDAVLLLSGVHIGEIVPDEVGINCPVDNGVGNVNALRVKFSGHTLCQGAQGEFGP